jgi:hypothetical protein
MVAIKLSERGTLQQIWAFKLTIDGPHWTNPGSIPIRTIRIGRSRDLLPSQALRTAVPWSRQDEHAGRDEDDGLERGGRAVGDETDRVRVREAGVGRDGFTEGPTTLPLRTMAPSSLRRRAVGDRKAPECRRRSSASTRSRRTLRLASPERAPKVLGQHGPAPHWRSPISCFSRAWTIGSAAPSFIEARAESACRDVANHRRESRSDSSATARGRNSPRYA